jgi:hypothetical protein
MLNVPITLPPIQVLDQVFPNWGMRNAVGSTPNKNVIHIFKNNPFLFSNGAIHLGEVFSFSCLSSLVSPPKLNHLVFREITTQL